jgi:flagellar capping protein FliD
MTEKQQPVQLPLEIQQQISILNARIQSLNLSTNDLVREMDKTFKAMAKTIADLQTENAELEQNLKSTRNP